MLLGIWPCRRIDVDGQATDVLIRELDDDHHDMDTCNATRRDGRQLLICELALNHDGEHSDGARDWPSNIHATGNRVIER